MFQFFFFSALTAKKAALIKNNNNNKSLSYKTLSFPATTWMKVQLSGVQVKAIDCSNTLARCYGKGKAKTASAQEKKVTKELTFFFLISRFSSRMEDVKTQEASVEFKQLWS